ncbi:DinB family protein [Stratiformator vulcanicus]|uniref:DinB superfamily protein n=1 Tax=Stratiformator vulcanicus TaxID=2527980 RepID=A0A517R4H4_9PLAN|nr:DinB family protein [Stratiformator vulcanicus]QDT38778.1 DinB superfamily protein [Stratiformator vulcanicus]
MLELPRHIFDFNLALAERLAEGIEENELDLQPIANVNPPRWILGHLAIGADFIPQQLGQSGILEESWLKNFGPGSTAGQYSHEVPDKPELLQTLNRCHANAVKALDAVEGPELARVRSGEMLEDAFPTAGTMIAHLMTSHYAFHLGQLSAWRRMTGRTPLF